MATSSAQFKLTFSKPQAKDDSFTDIDDVLDGALNDFRLFDVMLNDGGGSAADLYSAGVDGLSSSGAALSIVMGEVRYEVMYEVTQSVLDALEDIEVGGTLEDTFTYQIQLGNGTLSTAKATVLIEKLAPAVVSLDESHFGFEERNENWALSRGASINQGYTDPNGTVIQYGADGSLNSGLLLFGKYNNNDQAASVYADARVKGAPLETSDPDTVEELGEFKMACSWLSTRVDVKDGETVSFQFKNFSKSTSYDDVPDALLLYVNNELVKFVMETDMNRNSDRYANEWETVEFRYDGADLHNVELKIVGLEITYAYMEDESQYYIDNLQIA